MRKWNVAIMVAALVPASAWGVGVEWSYIEAGLIQDSELELPNGETIDGDGMHLEWSAGFGDVLFLQAALEAGSLELGGGTELAYDRFRIGPGLSTDIRLGPTVLAPWLRVGYRRVNYGSRLFDGIGGAMGVRWLIASRFEIGISGSYGETEADHTAGDAEIENAAYEVSLRYRFAPRWVLTAAYRVSELETSVNLFGVPGESIDRDRLLLGVRWNYAHDPTAVIDEDKQVGVDHDNYLQVLYIAGGELDRGPGPDSETDVDHGLLVHGSITVAGPIVVQASLLNTELEHTGGNETGLDWYSVGPGVSFSAALGAGTLDLYGLVTYERVDFVDARVYDGGGVKLGLRYRIGGFGIAPSARLFTTEAAGDRELEGARYGLDILYAVSPAVSLVTHVTHIAADLTDGSSVNREIEQTVYGAGLRFHFGGGAT